MSSATQHVIFQDKEPPSLLDEAPKDINVQCGSVPPADPLRFTDNCFGEFSIMPIESPPIGDVCSGQKIKRTWTGISDPCGNSIPNITQEITVTDQSPPVFPDKLPDVLLTCPLEVYRMEQVEPPNVTDDCTADDGISVLSGMTPLDGCKNVTVVWSAIDECNNIATTTQNVVFQDDQPPSLKSDQPENVVNVSCSEIPDQHKLVFRDNCWETYEVWPTDTLINNGTKCIGQTFERLWRGPSDSCGNVADDITQTIRVHPMGEPRIAPSSPKRSAVRCAEDAHGLTPPVAFDGCNQSLSVKGVFLQDTCTSGTMTWTSEVDACGSIAATTQDVSITGKTPTISCPTNVLNWYNIRTLTHEIDYGDCYSEEDIVAFTVVPTCFECSSGRLCTGDFEFDIDGVGEFSILRAPNFSKIEWTASIDFGCGEHSVFCSVGDC